MLAAEILIVASPTWVGRPSSLAQRALERMDAMISETGDAGTPVAYNRVACVVVTGNEDGRHRPRPPVGARHGQDYGAHPALGGQGAGRQPDPTGLVHKG
ncbi:hypothetical protein Acsp05_01950 [Actinokineospora sp. NBRC 105648]|nr:hypothetical protein Acsp05_01950 [Actinokineospora sp. NBRC 105648]